MNMQFSQMIPQQPFDNGASFKTSPSTLEAIWKSKLNEPLSIGLDNPASNAFSNPSNLNFLRRKSSTKPPLMGGIDSSTVTSNAPVSKPIDGGLFRNNFHLPQGLDEDLEDDAFSCSLQMFHHFPKDFDERELFGIFTFCPGFKKAQLVREHGEPVAIATFTTPSLAAAAKQQLLKSPVYSFTIVQSDTTPVRCDNVGAPGQPPEPSDASRRPSFAKQFPSREKDGIAAPHLLNTATGLQRFENVPNEVRNPVSLSENPSVFPYASSGGLTGSSLLPIDRGVWGKMPMGSPDDNQRTSDSESSWDSFKLNQTFSVQKLSPFVTAQHTNLATKMQSPTSAFPVPMHLSSASETTTTTSYSPPRTSVSATSDTQDKVATSKQSSTSPSLRSNTHVRTHSADYSSIAAQNANVPSFEPASRHSSSPKKPVVMPMVNTNPADQNPPCNTLYVGNLAANTKEDELRELFSRQRGYRRLCFRTKGISPMCFVEFEDVKYATAALFELQGVCLSNSVKGGIRLSFSKNPLGVRSSADNATSVFGANLNAVCVASPAGLERKSSSNLKAASNASADKQSQSSSGSRTPEDEVSKARLEESADLFGK
ncbi:hypothetical protein SJAG_01843 [Schizosaccharomyces japonicus yFS275]|uniref:RRM domain-containing protein n=1 Tax=Schizosaccharomyces japonicus (strain yFS275 / FY16936) TaxID=402676 RepID=B6JZ21_SCHJY|nr:hypothetical protein SJAG_01843 [Schizosaccharomyces japonicus yFS275]EEB06789.2 hypothetical protein SJAG_01843 [Schizosaccharomyces japonicus yFS275]